MKNLTSKISRTIKSLRKEKGWSLDVASKKTGVSKAMLGQIERKESIPTITTLWKIADGFETSFSSFIENSAKDSTTTISRKHNFKKIPSSDDKMWVTPIFPYDKKLSFEVFTIELAANCQHFSPAHKGNVIEHVIAIEGEVEILIKGKWHKLKTNEGLRFNANQPHGYRNSSDKKITFYNIIHY